MPIWGESDAARKSTANLVFFDSPPMNTRRCPTVFPSAANGSIVNLKLIQGKAHHFTPGDLHLAQL